jgi:hypothetical protein
MAGVLHQIWYKQEHLNKLYPFAVPYENKGLTIFFENDPISKIVMSSTSEKTAVCSWKLHQKMRRGHNLTQEVLDSDYQVLSFTRNSDRHQMLAMSAQWHKDFIPAIDILWQKLGFKRPHEAKYPFYQNAFSAKTDIYQDYVSNFLIPAMNLITTDPELNSIMLKPSGYGRLSRDSDLKSVKAKLGMDDYPLCPFVLERCAPLFFQMKGYRITYIPANL